MRENLMKNESVIIAGNGLSRLHFDLNRFKVAVSCELYACNLAHKNVTPDGLDADLVFAIDNNVREYIKSKCPTVELGEEWRYEPYEYWKSENRPFNNSGSIAIQWAIKNGKKDIHLFGFDCLIDGFKKTENVFAGNEFYKNKLSEFENIGRINYLNWIIETNSAVKFYIYYNLGDVHYILPHSNLEYRYEIHI